MESIPCSICGKDNCNCDTKSNAGQIKRQLENVPQHMILKDITLKMNRNRKR